jgi:P-type E1-E2 ATPase
MKEASSRPTTAAIGDGANDVSMIREAHVGLGIVLVSNLLSLIVLSILGQWQYNAFLHLSGLLKQNTSVVNCYIANGQCGGHCNLALIQPH